MVSAKEVAFFGGLKGDQENGAVSLLNLLNNTWSHPTMKNKIQHLGRDDHACADFNDGTFFTFGGYVNGSRTDEIIRFKQEGASFVTEHICGGEI